MKNYKIVPIILGIISTLYCGAVDLNVVNATDWAIKLTYRQGAQEPIEIILREPNSVFTIPNEASITELSMQTYGIVYGILAQPFDLMPVLIATRRSYDKSMKSFNIYLTTRKGFFGESWDARGDFQPLQKVNLATIVNPINAFPAARARLVANQSINPEHVLGVEPGASKQSIMAAVAYLKAKWDSKNFPNATSHQKKMLNSIKKLIGIAQQEALHKKWNTPISPVMWN